MPEVNSKKEVELFCKALDKSSLDNALYNYTEEEIKEFPFWLRCCYYIQVFNKNVFPKSIEEWAKEVGFLPFHIDARFYEDATKEAIKQVQRLINFVKQERERFKQEGDEVNV